MHDVQDRDTVVLPRRPDARSSSNMAKLSIVKVLEFSSQTLRSGVVVMTKDAPRGSALLFLRGAPAVIKNLVDPATVPHDFKQASNPGSKQHNMCMSHPLCYARVHAMTLLCIICHSTCQAVQDEHVMIVFNEMQSCAGDG